MELEGSSTIPKSSGVLEQITLWCLLLKGYFYKRLKESTQKFDHVTFAKKWSKSKCLSTTFHLLSLRVYTT